MKRLPLHLIQIELLPYFSSLDVFKLRLVSAKWAEAIKIAWCLSAKQEMLTHVQSLDLLYEKETICKIMDFKLNYIMACSEVMTNCFSQLPMKEILTILMSTDFPCTKQLAFAVAFLISPEVILNGVQQITEDTWVECYPRVVGFIQSDEFMPKYISSCRLESMPITMLPSSFIYVKQMLSQIDLSDLQMITQFCFI